MIQVATSGNSGKPQKVKMAAIKRIDFKNFYF